jgi:hypothetical protein
MNEAQLPVPQATRNGLESGQELTAVCSGSVLNLCAEVEQRKGDASNRGAPDDDLRRHNCKGRLVAAPLTALPTQVHPTSYPYPGRRVAAAPSAYIRSDHAPMSVGNCQAAPVAMLRPRPPTLAQIGDITTEAQALLLFVGLGKVGLPWGTERIEMLRSPYCCSLRQVTSTYGHYTCIVCIPHFLARLTAYQSGLINALSPFQLDPAHPHDLTCDNDALQNLLRCSTGHAC